MQKRALVLRRRLIRKVTMGLLLAGVLSVEGLVMSLVYRDFSRAPIPPQWSINPGACFQMPL